MKREKEVPKEKEFPIEKKNPLKQGLKLEAGTGVTTAIDDWKEESIKTRIETGRKYHW